MARPRAYVAKMPTAVSGSDGSGATLAVARALWHGFSLDDADAMTVLREFNARCLPPWTEGDLRHKLDSVKGYPYRTARGHLLGEQPPAARRAPPPPAKVRVRRIERRPGPPPEEKSSAPSEASAPLDPAPKLAYPVPGCGTPRPANVDLPDADWRAVEAVGMAGEPLVLAALAMFGPGCRVMESEAGA